MSGPFKSEDAKTNDKSSEVKPYLGVIKQFCS